MKIMGIFGAGEWNSHRKYDEETKTYTAVHDSGATLFIDGRLICNIAEERLTRIKMEGQYPFKSIEYCLSVGNIGGEDIDIVYMPDLACYKYTQQKYDGTLERMAKELFPNALFKSVSHHLCHAASSIFSSKFNEGCFITLDGTGSAILDPISKAPLYCERSSIGYFNKSKRTIRFFLSPSLNDFGPFHFTNSKKIYNKKTNNVDKFALDEGTVSGKVMGLSAYGNIPDKKSLDDNDYYLVDHQIPMIRFYHEKESENFSADDDAKILQKTFESALLDYLKALKERTYLEDNVCFAGGCFLNVLANTLIKKERIFKDIHIPPFTSDTGISFGAAAYASFIHDTEHEIVVPENLSLMGKIYDNNAIEKDLERFNLDYKKYENFEELCEFTAQELNKNKIIGWFQNSGESGPRALGSRSLLMHPGPASNKDIMNSRVKHREYWRPFAGIILEEHLNDYFEEDFCSPYMLYSFTVRKNKRDEIAAITHVDNTCRIQTLRREHHPEIHTLLDKFYKVSGLPVILNTSFNDNGEPIVETPEDAIRAFNNLDIDYLVIGNYIVKKKVVYTYE